MQSLIANFVQFVSPIAKLIFLKGKLGAQCTHSDSRFLWDLFIS